MQSLVGLHIRLGGLKNGRAPLPRGRERVMVFEAL